MRQTCPRTACAADDSRVHVVAGQLSVHRRRRPARRHGCRPQAHVAPVSSFEAVQAVIDALLCLHKVRTATHNIMAYRIVPPAGAPGPVHQDYDDDGESAAGGRLLHLLQVCIWGGGAGRSGGQGKGGRGRLLSLKGHAAGYGGWGRKGGGSRGVHSLPSLLARPPAGCFPACSPARTPCNTGLPRPPPPPPPAHARVQLADVRNVVVVVSRWFGGVLMGPSRFTAINNTARELLEQLGHMPRKGAGGAAGAGGGGGAAGGGHKKGGGRG